MTRLYVRSGVCVEQDVSVLEILHVRAVLEVLLQAVAALQAAGGGDGRLVDVGVSHDEGVGGFVFRGGYGAVVNRAGYWAVLVDCSLGGCVMRVLERAAASAKQAWMRGSHRATTSLHPPPERQALA